MPLNILLIFAFFFFVILNTAIYNYLAILFLKVIISIIIQQTLNNGVFV